MTIFPLSSTSSPSSISASDNNNSPENTSLNYIQKCIDTGNFHEAIQQLLALLVDENLPNLTKIYDYLNQLLPHFGESDLRMLEDRLSNLLKHPSPPEKQQKLALSLAHWHIDHVQASSSYSFQLPSYHIAMRYFAQALKLAEKNPSSTKAVHSQASQLFMKFIESLLLQGDTFKHKVEQAKATANPEEIKALLSQLENLKRFCCTAQDQELIRTLYRQAREVLNYQFKPLFKACLEDATRGIATPFALPQQYVTEKYHAELQIFRVAFTPCLSSNFDRAQLRLAQTHLTAHFKAFLQKLLDDVFTLLGSPKGSYDIRAMGSAGREELCLFSDLEPLILCEDVDYFSQALPLLQLMVLSLGETPEDPPLFARIQRGFFLDGPLSDAVRTPDALIRLQQSELHSDDPCTSLPHTALKSISLLCNTPTLFEQYQAGLQAVLKTPIQDIQGVVLRDHRAIALLKRRLQDYKQAWNRPYPHQVFNLKKHYLELLSHLLTDLGLFFEVEKTNTLDIIEDLVHQEVFTPGSGQLLQEAIAELYLLRLGLHSHYREQREEVYLEAGLNAGYVLKEAEKKQLEKTYWLILLPLYMSLEKVIGKDKLLKDQRGDLSQEFHQLDLGLSTLKEVITKAQSVLTQGVLSQDISTQEAGEKTETDRLKSFQTPIDHLASHLAQTKSCLEEHQKYFELLSQQSCLEPLRESYLQSLENARLSEEWIEKLAEIPNRAGARLSFKRREQKLQAILQAMTTETSLKVGNTQVKIVGPSLGERYLRPEIISQVIDQDGNIQHAYPGSAHAVSAAHLLIGQSGLHFKQKPTHPLMEYAIHNLFDRIAGHLTPATELLRFEVTIAGKSKMYPVLISETIEGKTLKDVEGLNLKLTAQQWSRWTWMLLCSVLTRPGDGRCSNYIFDPQSLIFCIDNDISFVEPVVQEMLSRKVNFCCALFCLFADQPLDPEVLRAFCALDPDAIFNGWIDDVIAKEQEYLALFSEKEREQLYNEDPNNRFKATILFREGTLATLHLQFCRLQNELLSTLQQQKPVYPLELLKNISSLRESSVIENASGLYLYQAYRKALARPSLEERLKAATSRPHDQSLTSMQSDQACVGKLPSLNDIEKKQQFTPAKAKEELCVTLLHRSSNYLSIGVIQGKRTIRASFKNFKLEEGPDRERQSLVLQALLSLMRMDPERPSSVTLQHCAVLDTKSLELFLHEDLEHLDLSFCPQIKDRDVETISQRCPHLHTLYLNGCSQLRQIASSGVFSSAPLDFARQGLNILHGHTNRVLALLSNNVSALFSLEGSKKIVSGNWDNTISLWDIESRKELKTLHGHTKNVKALISLEGGQKIASGSYDKTIRVWDTESGKELKTLHGHTSNVNALISLEGGKKIASGSHDKTIRIWDIESGQELKTLYGHTHSVNALISLEGGKKIVSGSVDGTSRIWDAESGKELKTLQGHWSSVRVLISLEGGKKIASGSDDRTIRIWDTGSGKELKILHGHTSEVNSLIVLEGGKKIASGSEDSTSRIWNVTPGLEHLSAQQCENLQTVRLKASLKTFHASKNTQLQMIDLETGCFPQLDLKGCDKLNLKSTLKTIFSRVIQSQEDDIFPTLLGPSIWIPLAEIVGEDSSYQKKLFSLVEQSKTKPYLATTAANAITLLNLAYVSFAGKDFRGIRIPGACLERANLWGADLRDADLTGVDLSEAMLGNAQLDRAQMKDVRLESGQGLKTLQGHTNNVTALLSLEGGKKIASGSWDNTIRIWDAQSGKVLKTLQGHTDWV